MSPTAPLRRTRGDLIATAVITLLALFAVAGVWWSSPIRGSTLTPAAQPYDAEAPLADVPDTLTPVWSRENAAVPGVHRPVTAAGLVITTDGRGISAVDSAGDTVWSYGRERELCSVAAAWNQVIVTHRSKAGCGDVVSIDAATGEYAHTRSAVADGYVVPVVSNDRVGTAGANRVELWRSDLVRTVEYGLVEAAQEADMQPNPDCRITSALTRTSLLAITEACPDGSTWLRLQKTTPEDSRAPEIERDLPLDSPDARLVAVGQSAATVLLPGEQPELISYDRQGRETERRPVDHPPPVEDSQTPFAAATADLPHHMSWFDGHRLHLLTPTDLRVDHVFEEAVGTGAAIADRLLFPTVEGVAVADWVSGTVEKVIPVDRGGYTGMIALDVVGGMVVEKRAGEIVGLAAG